MKEIWRTIPGFENFQVSSFGRVWRKPRIVACESKLGKRFDRPLRGKLMPQSKSGSYFMVDISDMDGYNHSLTVHFLVALAFIGPRPKGKQVRHLDGNSVNNSKDNIAYGTAKQNAFDKKCHGTLPVGKSVYNAKLTEEQIKWARKKYIPRHAKYGQSAMARKFGVSQSTLQAAMAGTTWSHTQ